MVSNPKSEYPVNRYDKHCYSHLQRVPYGTCWSVLLIAASLLNAKATMADAVSVPSRTMELFQTVDVNSDGTSSIASRGDAEPQGALKIIFAGIDPMPLRWYDSEVVKLSADSVDQARDVPDTGNALPADRRRRSAANAHMNDEEEALPLRVGHGGRWPSNQMWRKRPSILVDDDSHEENNDDTEMERRINEMWKDDTDDHTSQLHTSLDGVERSHSRELGSWIKLIPRHVAIIRRLHNDVTRPGSMRSTVFNRLISKNRKHIDSMKKDLVTTALGGRPGQKAVAVEQGSSDNEVVVERQKLEKRTTSDNPSVSELSFKRIVAKEPGSWNGSQKGWASNNVRIWG